MATVTKAEALSYHSEGRKGKIEVISTKPTSTQHDLSLAYTPGVADPCREIHKNVDDVYKYTAKGNLVAVISNGTAVLGLGDIGPEAGKPVMEGKGVLFKIFADIDVFDIEINEKDPDKIIEIVKAISPTFGGINLEDIKAPECFKIEQRLKEELKIPVMHDDQHGTAIISSAGLLNAVKIARKKLEQIRIVVNGAGAAAISCSRLYVKLGVKRENIVMLDSKGVLRKDRSDLNEEKMEFATDRDLHTLNEAMVDADMFLGLSVGNILSKEAVKTMAKNPIIFACANPNPEIAYEDAVSVREDLIMATGRSDYPNQVNNVLGFPFIFRGALDVMATCINEEMKIAAVKALAELATKPVPEIVNKAYHSTNIHFGPKYIIPKPMDPRLLSTVAPAVAKAAMDSGVARKKIEDWDAYRTELNERLGIDNQLMSWIASKAKIHPKRVVFADGHHYNILKAAEQAINEGIAAPIIVGNKTRINRIIQENQLELPGATIIDPNDDAMTEKVEQYAQEYFKRRSRKGITFNEALQKMHLYNYFGVMMVELNDADAFISGYASTYIDGVKPGLEIIGHKNGVKRVSGMYIMNTKKGTFFFSDCTLNTNPTTEDLVQITLQTYETVKRLDIDPVIAMVSYSNFGSTRDLNTQRVSDAVKILHRQYPEILVDGEFQANFALNKEIRKRRFPFSKITDKNVNTIIFPDLHSANICYKTLQEIGGAEAIGPVLLGLKKSIHILQLECSVREIINMVRIAVVDAQYESHMKPF
jgi:malate dehydrogenase (oxaloacetate-decarboxylating)(NADP+)